MAGSKPTADEGKNQVEAPEIEDQDFDADGVDLEDSGVSFDDAEDDGKPYDSGEAEVEEESDEDESDDEHDFDEEDGEAEEKDEEQPDEEASDQADESDPDALKQPTEEEIKQHNHEMAQRRIQAKKDHVDRVKATQQEYLDGAGDDPDESFKRHTEVEVYNSRVERNENALVTASDRAFAEFPILNSKNPVIRERVGRALNAFQAENVNINKLGDPIEVKGDLYEYLKEEAESIAALTGIGAREQIKDKDKEKRKTFIRPSRAPRKAKSNPMQDGFDEEANRY
jgi:hypothetical protein